MKFSGFGHGINCAGPMEIASGSHANHKRIIGQGIGYQLSSPNIATAAIIIDGSHLRP
jgi:hypothetical protein